MEQRIYHYTAVQGLSGILIDGFMKARRAQRQSDPLDSCLGLKLLREKAPDLFKDDIWVSMEKLLNENPRYVVSFSRAQDNETLWSRYGEGGAGACIVFDERRLQKWGRQGGWERLECVYDERLQNELLGELAEAVRKEGVDGDLVPFMTKLREYTFQFKCREKFEREQEIRFVLSGPRTPSSRPEYVEFDIRTAILEVRLGERFVRKGGRSLVGKEQNAAVSLREERNPLSERAFVGGGNE